MAEALPQLVDGIVLPLHELIKDEVVVVGKGVLSEAAQHLGTGQV